MRPFRPTTNVTPVKTQRAVRVLDQGFLVLRFPALGTATWVQENRVLAEYTCAGVGSNFALIKPYPTSQFPITVRDQGQRYYITANRPAYAYGVPYTGQTLSTAAIFEIWSFTGQTSAAFTEVTATISLRDQLLQTPVAPTTISASGLMLHYHYYPVYYPIVST